MGHRDILGGRLPGRFAGQDLLRQLVADQQAFDIFQPVGDARQHQAVGRGRADVEFLAQSGQRQKGLILGHGDHDPRLAGLLMQLKAHAIHLPEEPMLQFDGGARCVFRFDEVIRWHLSLILSIVLRSIEG